MVGVEILTQHPELVTVIENTFSAKIFFICLIVGVVFGIISAIIEGELFYALLGVALSFFLGMILGGIVGDTEETEVESGRTIYKATISDDVKMTEFLDRYEILEQDGKLYIIVERDVN